MKNDLTIPKKVLTGSAILALLVLLVGLAFFALNGRHARFWADDYAYSVVMRQGLVDGTREWYDFNGSRLSSFWFVGVIDLFGMNAVRFLPGLTILLFVGSVYWFFKRLIDFFMLKIPWIWTALAAGLLVYFSVLLMPTRLETLYWRMGTLHYTLPVPLTFINLALILSFLRGESSWVNTAARGLLIFLIAFIAGAHSEAAGAFLVGIYLLGMVLLWFSNKSRAQKSSQIYFIFALVGAVGAILLMARSPANVRRMEAMPPPATLADFIYYTLRYSLDFVVDSFKTQPLPNAIFFLASLGVSLAVLHTTNLKLSTRTALIATGAALPVTFGLIVFSVSTSVYAGTNYPAPRALMPARFALLGGLMTIAFFVSAILWNAFSRFGENRWLWATALVLVLVSLYTVRSYRIPINEGQALAAKAELWDIQDAEIKAARMAGEKDVIIQQYDVVETLISFFDDPDHWINKSAAILYGVNSITAIP